MKDSRTKYPASRDNSLSDFGTDDVQTLKGQGRFGAKRDSGLPAVETPETPLDEADKDLKYAYGSDYEETNKAHSKDHMSPFRR